MIIIAKNAANKQGHMSLLLEVKGSWCYFYYGSKSSKSTGASTVTLKKVKLPKKISQVNNSVGYKFNFTTSIYIKGDFSKSYSKAISVKKKKPKYSLLTNNCAQVSIEVLLASKGVYKWNQARVLKDIGRMARPNSMVNRLSGLFKNKTYNR